MIQARLTRRSAIAGFGFMVASGMSLIESSVAAESADQDALERYIRIRSSPDGSPVIWVHEGVLLIKLDGQVAKPVLRVGGVSFTQAIRREPGIYDWRLDEVGYYRALDNDDVLDRWTNPFTGVEIRPGHYRTPEFAQYSRDGVKPGKPLAPGMEYQGEITTLAEVGGIVAVTEDIYLRIPGGPGVDGGAARPDRQLSSLGTYATTAADLRQARSKWVDCQLSYSTMNSFARWLGMSGMHGIQNLRLAGRKRPHTDLGAIPLWMRERIAKDHPTFMDVPKQWRS
jgi:hypothetical protein